MYYYTVLAVKSLSKINVSVGGMEDNLFPCLFQLLKVIYIRWQAEPTSPCYHLAFVYQVPSDYTGLMHIIIGYLQVIEYSD